MNDGFQNIKKITLVIISSLFIGGFNILLSFMVQTIVDSVLSGVTAKIVILLLSLLLFIVILYPLIYNFNIKLSKTIDLERKECILNSIICEQLNKDLSSQERIKESDYIMLVNEDLENYSSKMSKCYIPLFQNTITILVALIYGFYYSYKISIAVLLFVVFYHLINKFILGIVLKKKDAYLDSVSNSKQFLFDSLRNIPIFRISGLQTNLINKMGKYLSEELSQKKAIAKIEIINNIFGEQLILAIEFIVFLLGIYYNLRGEISFGVVVGLWNGLIGSILWSSVELPYIYQNLSSSMSSEKRVKHFLNSKYRKTCIHEEKKSDIEVISTSELAFNFSKNEKMLTYADMMFENTGITLIIGNSGSGKSTLAKLLIGLYIPTEGKVIKGDMGMYYVSQSHEVFPLSIRDNIKLGNEIFSDAEIYDALQKAGLGNSFINESRTLDTVIDYDTVSGGEAQRIGIARSLIRKNQYIIMDEPFSNLDYSTSMDLIKLIKTLSNEHAFIIITHIFSEKFENCKVYRMREE